ncbi:MAG: hypothetical protein V3R56_01835 [Xanthomonadales bacterium]
MTEQSHEQLDLTDTAEFKPLLPSRRQGFKLFRRLFVYHLILAVAVVALVLLFPNFVSQLPVGGVTELLDSGDVTVAFEDVVPIYSDDSEIVNTVIKAAGQLDRLGYARQLMYILLGVWLLMLPVSWVHKGIHLVSEHDHSLDETMLILPGVVASIVLVVQHSLALAFSLAGIVAGVQFRRALKDTFDALFILVAIGTGIAAGVKALEIAAVLTVFFTYATLYVYFLGDGLESDYVAQKKALKELRKQAASKRQIDQNGVDQNRADQDSTDSP